MSYQSLSVDTEPIDGTAFDGLTFEDLGNVHVSLAGEARCNGDEESGAEWRCANCGQVLSGEQDEDGWPLSLDGASVVCYAHPSDPDGEGPHDPEPVPLSWANSAGITLDEEHDTIAVRISVGDPRGAFVLSVERVRLLDAGGMPTGEYELRLSVPTPEDGWLHMPLTPLASPGYYRIGA